METHLLVPMQLDVMALNRTASNTTPFLRFKMAYRNLQRFNSAEPRPFEGASSVQPEAGIYLHWTLPKALRHGRHNDDGTTTFPLVPNRWLIVRTQEGVAAGKAVKAWILESDFIDARSGTSPYVDPAGPSAAGVPVPVKVGRALRLVPGLASLATQSKPFLRAVGPGSAYFSVFSPGVENVFSFYDGVTGIDDISSPTDVTGRDPVTGKDRGTRIDNGRFSYTVTGWYSDPAHDPLSGTTWTASTDAAWSGAWQNDTFDWLVYAAGPDLPKRILAHTLVSGVEWRYGAESKPADNYPTNIQQTVKVAVGNTAVDALSGMVRLFRGSEAEADVLEAFQYGLLDEFDKPGSAESLNMAIRRHWFGASPGGTLWEIVERERAGDTSLPAPPAPVVTEPQSRALAALNAAQSSLDEAARLLESMQWNLYSLWWKYRWQDNAFNTLPVEQAMSEFLAGQLPLQVGEGSSCTAPGGIDPNNETWYICKVKAQANLVRRLTEGRDAAQRALAALLDPAQELKGANMPEYHAPNDPVLLVTGLGRSTNFDPDSGLLCRLPSQTVTAMTVAGTTYTAGQGGGTDISSRIPKLDDPNRLLPAAALALHVESFFLSPTLFAVDILGSVGRAEDVRTAIDALAGPAAGAHFPPEKHARGGWVQPWVPLLLDWDITILKKPAYSCGKESPTCTLNRDNWEFDGTDYRWIGPTEAGAGDFDLADAQMQLMGRTFITPQLSFTLADQLKDYVRKHEQRDPDLQKLLEDLESYISEIQKQDILSQRLSGLTAMLMGRQTTQVPSPTGALKQVIGDNRHGYPMPSENQPSTWIGPPMNFTPLRGAFLVINRLSVIDTFGRTVNLMLGNFSDNPQTSESVARDYFFPIAGRDMKAPTALDPRPGRGRAANPTKQMLQLTPRMTQDSQLRLRLTTNDGSNQDIHVAAGSSPVCGWVVPNHLDRSLAFYAPDGSAWGELFLSLRNRGVYLPVWQPDPTNPDAPQSIDAIPNDYVRWMLSTLVARSDNGRGFTELLTVIDETLWTINPLGQRQDEHLSVMIGRPLAIVRAEMSLRVRGLMPYNQDWWNTFAVDQYDPPSDPTAPVPLARVDGNAGSYLWPVRLGSPLLRDDGLIGYFVEDPASPAGSFKVFNTLRRPAGGTSDYLRPIGRGNYVSLRFTDDATRPDAARNQLSRMTMLVDPRGGVHAFSGLLPVASLAIPSTFVKPAFEKMFYTFRAGPFLTSPDEIRLPRPAEQEGTWSWFDHVLGASVPVADADGKVRFPTTPPLVKEGWLKFTPNPSNDHE